MFEKIEYFELLEKTKENISALYIWLVGVDFNLWNTINYYKEDQLIIWFFTERHIYKIDIKLNKDNDDDEWWGVTVLAYNRKIYASELSLFKPDVIFDSTLLDANLNRMVSHIILNEQDQIERSDNEKISFNLEESLNDIELKIV